MSIMNGMMKNLGVTKRSFLTFLLVSFYSAVCMAEDVRIDKLVSEASKLKALVWILVGVAMVGGLIFVVFKALQGNGTQNVIGFVVAIIIYAVAYAIFG